MSHYRMSYTLKTAPPKPREKLTEHEGLADIVVFHSVLGSPGEGPHGLSIRTGQLGPQGLEPLSAPLAYTLAASLLNQVAMGEVEMPEDFKQAAATALSRLRHPVLNMWG